jgi:hypothetical protein
MVYGIAIPVSLYQYIGVLRYIGRDKRQCSGPSAGQTSGMAPGMHMKVSFSVSVLVIPRVALFAIFSRRCKALNCLPV